MKKYLLIAPFFVFGLTGCVEQAAKDNLNQIENQVAQDAVEQYNIAKQQGDKMQIYVQASMVCAAYLQANDQDNYNKWKEIEKQDAIAAGVQQ